MARSADESAGTAWVSSLGKALRSLVTRSDFWMVGLMKLLVVVVVGGGVVVGFEAGTVADADGSGGGVEKSVGGSDGGATG